MAKLQDTGRMPELPIFVDSPLAEQATRVFSEHPECYDEELRAYLNDGGKPFYPPNVRYIRDRKDSIALNDRDGPMIILAGSGMCEGGRIVHHLKHALGDSRHTVLFVGWCAPWTLGRRIVDKQKEVRIHGRSIRVQARVRSLRAYSAHADRTGLLEFLTPAAERGSAVYLVHGDEDTALAFAEELRGRGFPKVVVPETYATYELERRR
jgi:metallo-beta-lactamase family protein